MKVGAGRFPGKAGVGEQAPQGKDAEAGQRKSRLSAQLDLTSTVGRGSHGELERVQARPVCPKQC